MKKPALLYCFICVRIPQPFLFQFSEVSFQSTWRRTLVDYFVAQKLNLSPGVRPGTLLAIVV